MSRVSHPLLRLEVLRPDGTRATEHRVFCRQQRRSVPAGSCCACVYCDAVTPGPEPAIVCSIPDDPSDDYETEVGSVLHGETVAVNPAASIRDALAVMSAEGRHLVAVVGEGKKLVGIVHEVTFLHRTNAEEDLATTMSSGLAIHEATSVHRALRLLASAHLREAIVVDDAGVPLGTFRDVDGLRWIARTRPRHFFK
jgi:CBS domain-containing protein